MYKRRKSSLGAKALGMGIVAAGWVAAVSLINTANAEDNGVALKPQMGWSTWSFIRRNPTESNFEAQALAMHNNLQSHGFKYVNLDDFWYLDPRVSVDEYGRWAVDTTKFPDGMAAIGRYTIAWV
jgi:alpha-galactosidase